MGNSFLCPQCDGHLKVGDSLVFATRTRENIPGLILMSPQLGNYKVVTHTSFDFELGDYVEFFCPLCHAQLSSEKNENLAKIIMMDDELKKSEILFSKIAGEHCTYRIVEGEEVDKFGKDSGKYF
jgi:transcription initiation factor IIE alpha subunit